MKTIKVWENLHILNVEYLRNINEICERIKNGTINSVFVKDEYIPGDEIDFFEENIFLKNNKHATYTDDNHPCFVGLFGDMIIGKEFYKKNENQIVNALKNKALKQSLIIINDLVYSDDFIKEIIKKNNEATIEFNKIMPSDEIIELLNNNHIESYYYVNGKKTPLSTKYAIEKIPFKDLERLNKISIPSTISLDEIKNLSYCNENTIVKIDEEQLEEDEYLQNIKYILDNIKDKKLIIKISSNKRSILEKSGILDFNFNNINIIINSDLYDYSFDEYKAEEQKLNILVEDIKNSDMTPFEKYIAIYNIVKNYKPYKESENKEESRYLRYILDNEYMVCVGYSKLFEALLDKVGIQSLGYSPQVDISYDKGFTEEEIPLNHAGHARLMVNMYDEKYGINGFYVSDPTWDNNLENDLYGNLLMPMDYMQKSKRLFKIQTLDFFFDVHNIQEYNIKINSLLKRELNKIKPNKNEQKYKREIANTLKNIFKTVLLTIKGLDYNKYIELKNKYDYLNEYIGINKELDILNNLINDYYDFFNNIGPYIVSKSNKEVNQDVISLAITNVKLKQMKITPQNAEEYKKNIEKELESSEIKNRPYEFPNNYLSDTDDGVTVISRRK